MKIKSERREELLWMWTSGFLTTSKKKYTIHENADRITESARSRSKVFALKDYHIPIRKYHTKNYECESLTFW
jgi:hypothetical protein